MKDNIKKILMTADTIGGVWTYTLELVKSLRNYDIEVHLATMGSRLNKEQQASAASLHNLIVYESNYALEWMEDPWADVDKSGEWLLSLEEEIEPDIVHLNGYAHGSLNWKAPVIIVGHSDVLSWWQEVKKEKAPEQWVEYYQRVKEGLQQADLVVGVSQFMLDHLQKIYGPLNSTTVIYNGRTAADFTPGGKKEQVFGMGRLWDEAKNVKALQVIANKLAWPVFIAGEDYGLMKAESGNFYYTGLLGPDEVARWLSTSSIFALPAKYEPFGLSALEAALSGCALVLGNIASLREIWDDAALYVNPEDHNALNKAITNLINDPALRNQFAERALRKAYKYNPDTMAKHYYNAYRNLLIHTHYPSI